MLIAEIHNPIYGGLDRARPTLEIDGDEDGRKQSIDCDE